MFDEFRQYWSAINTTYERYARNIGMSYSTLEVLCEIYNADAALTQRMICEITHLPKTTVNAIVKDMVKQNYVELQPMQNDRRQKGIFLTDEGRAYAQPIVEKMSTSELQAFQTLDKQTMQAMIAGVKTYQENFDKKLNHTKGGQ
jgi:DNA-binding MarR family transcriptional regulator